MIEWDEQKMAGKAFVQGPVLAENIARVLQGKGEKELQEYKTGPEAIMVTITPVRRPFLSWGVLRCGLTCRLCLGGRCFVYRCLVGPDLWRLGHEEAEV